MSEPEPEPEPEQTIRKAGRPRSAQSQQAILGATLEIFAEEGFQGLSIEAVAKRARVGKTTIYRYWPSKEDLIRGAVNMVRIDTDIQDSGNIRNDLLYMLRLAQEISNKTPLLGKLVSKLIAEVKTNPEFAQFFFENLIAVRLKNFLNLIERAQDRGELRQDVNAMLILNLIGGSFLYQIIFSDLVNPFIPIQYKSEDVIDTILRGVGWQAVNPMPPTNTVLF